MLRGVNRQLIFEDEEDCAKFCELLNFYWDICGYDIYAYCLMSNHVHLLIKEAVRPAKMLLRGELIEIGPGEEIDLIMKRLSVAYVYYFNHKYKRTGHLFQDRYRSEAVETDSYFLSVLRYIHRNPVKGGLCAQPEDYEWSSWREYLTSTPLGNVNVEKKYAFGLMNKKSLIEYTNQDSNEVFMDVTEENDGSVTDSMAKIMIEAISGCHDASEFQRLEKAERDEYFRVLHDNGLAIWQMARLTGFSRGVIQRAVKE